METEGSKPLSVSYSKRAFTASFKADPELWSRFKEECTFRGVSICHVLEALMEAWIQGQKATATVIKPVHIELHMEHVVKRPRRKKVYRFPWEVDKGKTWPPNCESADDFLRGSREVGCKEIREYIKLEKCWRCYLARVTDTG